MNVHANESQMVNNVYLSLAAVVLLAVFGSGVIAGLLVGGDVVSPQTNQPGVNATPDGTDAADNSTPAGSDAGPAAGREPISPREFSQANISAAIVERLNAERNASGLSPLSTSRPPADDVARMADSHADSMAEAGRVAHTIDGVNSADRYRNNGLYEQCLLNSNGNYIENPKDNDFELVAETVAGQPYTENGTQQFNANETAVAEALTDQWLSSDRLRERFLYSGAETVGVGVTVSYTGAVYATVNVCS